MRRFEQIKSHKKERTEKQCNRDTKPEAGRRSELIPNVTALVHAIDQCLRA
jgi:hypothetical protein